MKTRTLAVRAWYSVLVIPCSVAVVGLLIWQTWAEIWKKGYYDHHPFNLSKDPE